MKIRKTITSLLMVITMVFSMMVITPRQVEAAEANWTSVWSTSMVDATVKQVIEYKRGAFLSAVVNMANNTVRVALKVQGGGDKLRLKLTNEFGTRALPIQAVSVGKTDSSRSQVIKSNTAVDVTYNGKKAFSIPAGQKIVTDDINMKVSAGEQITVNIYFGNYEPHTIGLYGGDAWTHVIPGDYATVPEILGRQTFLNYGLGGEQLYADDSAATGHFDLIPALCEVDAYGTQLDGCIVVFGDSTITNEIPNYMAENLRAAGINNLSVTMAGIKGNRLIHDGVEDSDSQGPFLGIAGIKRFEKDALEQANVKLVIVKIGDNDIVHPYCSDMHSAPADYYEMQDGFRYLSDACQKAGVYYYISEIQAWKGYTRDNTVSWSPEIDQLRWDLNKWILNEHDANTYLHLDFITDGDGLYKDETTDGAHPNDKGQRKVAERFAQQIIHECGK